MVAAPPLASSIWPAPPHRHRRWPGPELMSDAKSLRLRPDTQSILARNYKVLPSSFVSLRSSHSLAAVCAVCERRCLYFWVICFGPIWNACAHAKLAAHVFCMRGAPFVACAMAMGMAAHPEYSLSTSNRAPTATIYHGHGLYIFAPRSRAMRRVGEHLVSGDRSNGQLTDTENMFNSQR